MTNPWTNPTQRQETVSNGSNAASLPVAAPEQRSTSPMDIEAINVPPPADSTGIDSLLEQILTDIHDLAKLSKQLAHLETIICDRQNPPIDELVQSNITPRIVALLSLNDWPKLQYSAARLLTEIASGTPEQAKHVVAAGACPHFIELLRSDDLDLVELVVWALAKIALVSRDIAELLIERGVVPHLTSVVFNNNESSNQNLIRNVCRCLSNLFSDYAKPLPPALIRLCLPAVRIALTYNSHPLQLYACQALSSFVDKLDEVHLDKLVELGILDRIVTIIQTSTQNDLLRSSLIILEYVSELNAQLVIDRGIIPIFKELLTDDRLQADEEVLTAVLQNIAATSESWIQAVIDAGLVPLLIKLLQSNSNDVQEEAVNAVCEITSGGRTDQVDVFFQLGVLRPLVSILGCREKKIFVTRSALIALENVIRATRTTTCVSLWQSLRRLPLERTLAELRGHDDHDIGTLGRRLTAEYWVSKQYHDQVLDLDN